MVFLLPAVLAVALGAPDAPRRVAVVVGANAAIPGQAPLRFAQRDAQAVADALTDVGHFARSDVDVLLDPTPDQLLQRLDARLAELHAAGGETLLLLYYSGHADEAALYPSGKALPFSRLKERLERDVATVRVGIIDACRGGAWTQAKGLVAEPAFDVQVPMNLASEGSVLIASSSGLESAHESDALQGSFFTHYFLAGLRGAANQSVPGSVTLGEAYAYARERTVRDTALQAGAAQHPSFSNNLKGRAELTLARLDETLGALRIRQTRGPLQLIDSSSGVALLELPEGARTVRLGVPPGRYLLRRAAGEQVYSRGVEVLPGTTADADESSLVLLQPGALALKGFSEPARPLGQIQFGTGWSDAEMLFVSLFPFRWLEAQIGAGVMRYAPADIPTKTNGVTEVVIRLGPRLSLLDKRAGNGRGWTLDGAALLGFREHNMGQTVPNAPPGSPGLSGEALGGVASLEAAYWFQPHLGLSLQVVAGAQGWYDHHGGEPVGDFTAMVGVAF